VRDPSSVPKVWVLCIACCNKLLFNYRHRLCGFLRMGIAIAEWVPPRRATSPVPELAPPGIKPALTQAALICSQADCACTACVKIEIEQCKRQLNYEDIAKGGTMHVNPGREADLN